MLRKTAAMGLLAGLALLLAACGGQNSGGGGSTGSVSTPGGQVQAALQGGTFTQGPTVAQGVTPPQGFQAPYGAIAFTAQVPQGGTLTVTLTFPSPIPQGAVLKKYLNNAWQDVPGAQLSGNTATYRVQDGGALDGDGAQNGQVVDPVALLEPSSSGGGAELTWTVRWAGQLSDLTYGNGRYVAVGNQGVVMTSPDGDLWVAQSSGTDADLRDVIYGNGTFVAVGVGGTILTSPDGERWTPQSSGVSAELLSVTYGNGLFVAVGAGGIILTSPDGATWMQRSAGKADSLTGVTYGDGRFVAVGLRYYGAETPILTSLDGTNWTVVSSGTRTWLNGVAYGNGRFVAVGDFKTVLVSQDGLTWAELTLNSGEDHFDLYDVAYGNGSFVAVDFYGSRAFVSADGVNWTVRDLSREVFGGVGYGGGRFIAVGRDILTSPDGSNWTLRRLGSTINAVTYGSGRFVAVAFDGRAMVSPDGVAWTGVETGVNVLLNDIVYGSGLFVAVGDRGVILTSTDGENWTARSSGTTYSLVAATYGGGLFVAVGANATVVISRDGVTWTAMTLWNSDWPPLFSAVAYGNGRFVVARGRVLFTSTDGVEWRREPDPECEIFSVTYGMGRFVALGGCLLVSADGISWARVGFHAPLGAFKVKYAGDFFVAPGEGGLQVSADGEAWRVYQLPLLRTLGLFDVAHGDGRYVAVGTWGTLVTSP